MYKHAKQILSKKQRKTPKRSAWKISKSLKKQNYKSWKKSRERYQNFTEEEEKTGQYYQKRKKNLPDYRRNYYVAHKK